MSETDTMAMARRMREMLASRQAQQAPQSQPTNPPAEQPLSQTRRRPAASTVSAAYAGNQNKFSAANSHVQNDKYMADFDRAWEEMNRMNLAAGAPAPAPAPAPAARARPLAPARQTRGPAPFAKYPPRVSAQWFHGPLDQAGVLEDISDRPSLCAAANWSRDEVVVGSSDHALYVIDAAKGKRKRTLYNKTNGHSEWVSCVACLPDGKVVSGGMDSRMWMWPSGSTRGMQMDGHSGPISKVEYNASTSGVVSASYDKTVRLWALGARGSEVGCLMGHDAPVMELAVHTNGHIISGDRSGTVILWDASGGDNVSWRMKGVHKGHVTALCWADEGDASCAGLFMSGGQDGVLRAWDPRSRSNPARVQLHVNEQGHGAVSEICAGGAAAAGMVVTAGADGTFRVLEPRQSFALMSTIQLTNFPYSMAVAGGLALVGCGDGSLHVIDIQEGTTLYALGAHKGAVRTICACEDRVLTSGDDGNTVLYQF